MELVPVQTLECQQGTWSCLNSQQCINDTLLCSGIPQCYDGSDENVALCGKWNSFR